MVSAIDRAVELERLLVHARFAAGFRLVARVRPRQAGLRVDIHQQGKVRLQAAAGNAVERHHVLRAQPAPVALVDQRRIREPVGQHHFAARERRQNPLIHVLRARSEVKQQLGGGAQFLVGAIEQDAADFGADGRAAWLGCLEHGAPHPAQPRRQPPHLRGFPGAVHALESDEDAAWIHVRIYCNDVRRGAAWQAACRLAIGPRGGCQPSRRISSCPTGRAARLSGWAICPTTGH